MYGMGWGWEVGHGDGVGMGKEMCDWGGVGMKFVTVSLYSVHACVRGYVMSADTELVVCCRML